ncbi:MAG: hypothetical protein BBJ57_07510 [Desulfobacterales bacterium PC51MH44]|nr:MAG: hypothetical protein BBJ57_07510 [Desulfobacterales bacterium PC51MH44]
MAFKLRDVIKKSRGGMIGVTIGGKQRWFEEDDFMEMFDKEGTKEVLIDSIKHGRSEAGSAEIPPGETETPFEPKADLSKTRPPEEWDETEPKAVYDKNVAEPTPEPTPEQPAKVKSEYASATEEIEGRAKPSPYGREEEVEEITPQNFSVFEKRTRERLKQHLRKFDFLQTLHPKDAAKRKIAESEEEWFDEFAESKGRRGMQFELLDDYKKDKDEGMREFLYKYQKFHTLNSEAEYDITNQKFFEAKRQRDEMVLEAERQLDVIREKMNEKVKLQKEEAAKHTPEQKVKDLKAYAKATKSLHDAIQEKDKETEEALRAEIKLLGDRLGKKPLSEAKEAAKEKKGYGLKNVDEMRKLLDKKGYTPEQIESTLKAYADREK